jgi:DNA-binding transcriptional LysR family regulator
MVGRSRRRKTRSQIDDGVRSPCNNVCQIDTDKSWCRGLEEVTCAAPDYLQRFGTPLSLDQLDGHRMVGFRSSASGTIMPLEFTVAGHPHQVTLPCTVSVSAAESLVAAAHRGLGIIQVPRYHLRDSLAEGSLLPLLPQFPSTPMPVSLLYPRNRQLSPRVRVFIDWFSKVFATRNG